MKAVILAAHEPCVKCVVAQVSGMGGGRGPAEGKITVPTLITVAEKEELMGNNENGKKAFDAMQKSGFQSEYHVLPGIGHCGACRESFAEAAQLAAA